MEYDDDMVRWTTALQSVLPTLNVAATLIQAAWRRLKVSFVRASVCHHSV